jgi:hypothetical protein
MSSFKKFHPETTDFEKGHLIITLGSEWGCKEASFLSDGIEVEKPSQNDC